MKQHLTEINGRRALIVDLPEGVTISKIDYDADLNTTFLTLSMSGTDFACYPLTKHNWQLYGSPFSLLEEQAKEVVEKMPWGYENYKNYNLPEEVKQQMV